MMTTVKLHAMELFVSLLADKIKFSKFEIQLHVSEDRLYSLEL